MFHTCHCISIFLCLYVKISIQQVSAEGPPRKMDISYDDKIISAHYKKDLELKCPIDISEASEPVFFDWLRKDKSLYNEKGYSVTNKGILKIKSVSKQHGGIYSCECVNGFGFVQVNITVIVDDPEFANRTSNVASRMQGIPPVIKRRSAIKFIHKINEHATFHCNATAVPTPRLFWLKDGQQIEETDYEMSYNGTHSIVRLKNLKKIDAGTYTCIAYNKFGTDEIHYTLYVAEPSVLPKILTLEPTTATTKEGSTAVLWFGNRIGGKEPSVPSKILSLEPTTAIIKEGSTAVFWCKVKSKTNLKLHIQLKELNIKEDEEPIDYSGTQYYKPLKLSDGIGANGVHQSQLIISNVDTGDSGIYVCLALNDKDFNAMNGILTVVSAGEPSSALHLYFSKTRDMFFVATVTIGVVVILIAVMIVSYLCCKKNSTKGRNNPAGKLDCENQIQMSALIQKPNIKDPIPYPDFKTQQSKTKLLCGDTHYNCEHTEHEVSRLVT